MYDNANMCEVFCRYRILHIQTMRFANAFQTDSLSYIVLLVYFHVTENMAFTQAEKEFILNSDNCILTDLMKEW